MSFLTIGKVAQVTGLTVDTLRYYERRGLIDEPTRSSSGYRQYGPTTIRQLQFIIRAKTLGFTLKEIGGLLDLRVTPGASCEDVQSRAESKIARIDERIAQLETMKRVLANLVEQCGRGGSISDCPILETLAEVKP